MSVPSRLPVYPLCWVRPTTAIQEGLGSSSAHFDEWCPVTTGPPPPSDGPARTGRSWLLVRRWRTEGDCAPRSPRHGGLRLTARDRIRLRLEVFVLRDELAGDEGCSLRVFDSRHPGPRSVEWAGDDLAAE